MTRCPALYFQREVKALLILVERKLMMRAAEDKIFLSVSHMQRHRPGAPIILDYSV